MSDAGSVADGGVRALSKKFGPLPVWGWGLILGVLGVVVFWYRSRNSTANQDATTTVQAGNPVTGEAGYDGTADTSSYQTDGLSPAVVDQDQATMTNTVWLSRAVSAVASSSGVSATLVSQALQRFIQGQTVTPTQQQYIDKAIALQGYPPEGTLGTTGVAAPTAPPKSTTTPTKPANPSKPVTPSKPAAGKLTVNEQRADRLFLDLLGRHIDNVHVNTATQMFNNGKNTAQVTAWIKNSTEYKQKHPKGK